MKAVLEVPYEEKLEEYFAPENKEFPRGSYDMTRKDDTMVFSLQADDATALRTVFSSVIKQLIVWEKTRP